MFFLALLLLILAQSEKVFALDRRRNLTQYHHRVWQDRDGLPQNTILSIAQTPDGYLWLGTEVGLARFDGVRFVIFDKKNTPEIKNNFIASLLVASDGSLWIGTRGGLAKLKDREFTSFTRENGLVNDSIRALLEDTTGAVWIGTDNGLNRFRANNFDVFKRRDGLPTDSIRSLHEDAEGSVWIGTSDGLARFKNEKIEDLTAQFNLPPQTVRAISSDDGGLWIGIENGGLRRFEGEKVTIFTEKEGLSSRSIRALKRDRDGNLWIGTDGGGLNRLTDGVFKFHNTQTGFSGDIVRAIYEDREGSLWLGTEGGGLNQLQNGKVTTFTTREGLSNDFARVIRQDRAGRVWIGTEGGGLNLYENGKLKPFAASGLPDNLIITALLEDRAGNLWVGTEENGLRHFQLNKPAQVFGSPQGLLSSTVTTLYEDREGVLWVGTYSGLTRMKNGKFTVFTTRDGLPANYIKTIYEDRDGNLWIGTRDKGLSRLKDGQFTAFGKSNGMPETSVTAFHEDADETLWITTNAGLVRRKNDSFEVFTTDEGLFSDNLYQVLEDPNGNLWLSSNKGIFRVSKTELNEVGKDKSKRLNPLPFTTADGMKSSECSGEGQPAGWRASDGKLWFPTVRGVVVIEPNNIPANSLPPLVHLEQITADKKTLDQQNGIELAAETGELTLNYTATSLLAPENVRFKYRLEGLEKDWIEAGTRRTAYYTNLPPGEFRFRVMAANNDGVWSESEAVFAFVKKPYFYQTYWFYALCAGALGLVVWLIYLVCLRQLKHEFAAVTRERNRIAREWHDTLAAGFAAISWQLEAGAKQLDTAPEMAKSFLEVAQKMVKHSLTEARRALWDLRSNAAENGDFPNALGESLRQLASGRTVNLDYSVSGTTKNLPADFETNLLRIGQEAVSNALNHSEANRVEVVLSFDTDAVGLQIHDDGCGFNADEINGFGHFGLTGMRERAKKFGGEFSLESEQGNGTKILVKLPLINKNGNGRN